jgi:hypothetical protein
MGLSSSLPIHIKHLPIQLFAERWLVLTLASFEFALTSLQLWWEMHYVDVIGNQAVQLFLSQHWWISPFTTGMPKCDTSTVADSVSVRIRMIFPDRIPAVWLLADLQKSKIQ